MAAADPRVDVMAERAYQAFCDSAQAYFPSRPPAWLDLPETLKAAWKAAAVAMLEFR